MSDNDLEVRKSFFFQFLGKPLHTEFSSLKIFFSFFFWPVTCSGRQRAMCLICFMEIEETAYAAPITLEATIQLSFLSKEGC